MKAFRIVLAVVVLSILAVPSYNIIRAENSNEGYQPEAGAKPELLTGEVISLCNYLAKGHRGDSYAEEGRFLVEQRGLPVAILAEDGDVYVAIMKGFKPANEKLAPLLGKKVNARGVVRRHPGANLIEVQIVSEAID